MPGWGDLYLMNERFSLFYYVHCICMFIVNEHTNTMNNQSGCALYSKCLPEIMSKYLDFHLLRYQVKYIFAMTNIETFKLIL